MILNKCVECGVKFRPNRSDQIMCSEPCRRKRREKAALVPLTCPHCHGKIGVSGKGHARRVVALYPPPNDLR